MSSLPKRQREPSHGRVAESVPELLTWGTQYLTQKKTSKAFVRATRPSFYALVLKNNVTVKTLHWPAVPHVRNSIAQGLFGAIIQLQPLPWDDSRIWFESSRVNNRARRNFFLAKKMTINNGKRESLIRLKVDEHEKLKSVNAEPYARCTRTYVPGGKRKDTRGHGLSDVATACPEGRWGQNLLRVELKSTSD